MSRLAATRTRLPWLVATAVAALAQLAIPTPGFAASPNGGCGNGFTWATIEEIRALRPGIPPGAAESVDLNGNGALCYQEQSAVPDRGSPFYGRLNLVDDRAPSRS